jgi:hypothetical protein
MKKEFPEFYRLETAEIKQLWEECLFVFDANVLLNLYRYSFGTSSNLIEIIKNFSDRIWIPHQFAHEYQRNRMIVIQDQKIKYDKSVNTVVAELTNISDLLGNYSSDPPFNIPDFKEKLIDSQLTYPDCNSKDGMREDIDVLFDGKVGECFDATRLASIYEAGIERYRKEVPPGYCDEKEKDKNDLTKTKKFGDLVGWFQIMEKSKESGRSVIFITSERKEDWWQKVKSKTVGPRYELTREFQDETGNMFYMYDMKRFLSYAKESYTVNDKTLDEVEKVEKLNNEPEIDEKNDIFSSLEIPVIEGAETVETWKGIDSSDTPDVGKEVVPGKEIVSSDIREGAQIDF